jgi:hypothetical protein
MTGSIAQWQGTEGRTLCEPKDRIIENIQVNNR